MNILDMLFLRDAIIDRNLFGSLFFSFDDVSFVGFNKDLIYILKKYDNYEIIKERNTSIGEFHHELKYIISTNDNKYFIRVLTDDSDLIYDILIYSISDLNKINRIFFPEILSVPDELKKLGKTIIYVNDNVNLVFNEGLFTKYIGYEDWDYKNKCLNKLDLSVTDNNFKNYFQEKDFINTFEFIKNGGDKIVLKINIKYINGFYVIEDVL